VSSAVIDLYCFPPALGLPSPDPFALKTEVHLKMMGFSYNKRVEGYADAPKAAWCRDRGYGRTDPNPAWGQATRT